MSVVVIIVIACSSTVPGALAIAVTAATETFKFLCTYFLQRRGISTFSSSFPPYFFYLDRRKQSGRRGEGANNNSNNIAYIKTNGFIREKCKKKGICREKIKRDENNTTKKKKRYLASLPSHFESHVFLCFLGGFPFLLFCLFVTRDFLNSVAKISNSSRVQLCNSFIQFLTIFILFDSFYF